MRVLLMGPPNVGKSVLFNRLTGLDVDIANYPGTTVEYKEGKARIDDETYELIDVPGTYTLEASNEAEKIAVDMLSKDPDGVVCVLDSKNLDSSIYILLQIIERRLPTVAVINKTDLISGSIDNTYLSREFGIPVLETVAIKDKGIPELKDKIRDILNRELPPPERRFEASWSEAEELADRASKDKGDDNETRLDKWGDLLVKPFPGIPIAILILALTFSFVVGVGLALRQLILLPFFENLVFPPIISAVESLVINETIRNILVGEYGFLIKSLEWPIGLVTPYIISFYIALSVLEDSGYMPRLAVLIDGIFKKMRLSGSHIIPFMLGYGCTIPSIMSTRTMSDRKNRMIVSTMVCLAIPCVAQSGAFIALLAEHSFILVILVFSFSLLTVLSSGLILGRILKPVRPPTIQEVPDLLIPDVKIFGKKLWMRLKHFMLSGALPMILIIGVASILYETGILVYISEGFEPFISNWLRLPKETTTPLILGLFRRELTVLPLLGMELSTLQLFVASIIALLYVPCIAVLGILGKEFGGRLPIIIFATTTVFAFFIGGIIAQIGSIVL